MYTRTHNIILDISHPNLNIRSSQLKITTAPLRTRPTLSTKTQAVLNWLLLINIQTAGGSS